MRKILPVSELHKNMDIEKLIKYIDKRFADPKHFSSAWHMENGDYIPADVGYAEDWWDVIGKEEVRKFGRDNKGPEEDRKD